MAKFKIAYIVNKKARAVTFKRRKDGLMKKLQELVTLCGVEACIFVHNPDADLQQPDAIWPPDDPGTIRRIIDLYRAKKTDAIWPKEILQDSDFNDQGQSSAVDQSSGMPMIPCFDFPDDQQDYMASDFNDQGQSSAVAQSLMPMIPYFDFPDDQQDYMASYSSIDPVGMMDAIFGSLDWGDSQEFGSQFFPPYGYIPPSRHSTVCSASSEHYVNLADLCPVVDF